MKIIDVLDTRCLLLQLPCFTLTSYIFFEILWFVSLMVSFLGVNYVQVRPFFSHVVEAISSSKDLGRLSDTLD